MSPLAGGRSQPLVLGEMMPSGCISRCPNADQPAIASLLGKPCRLGLGNDLDRVRPAAPTAGHGLDHLAQHFLFFDRAIAPQGEVLKRPGLAGRDDVKTGSIATSITAVPVGHDKNLARCAPENQPWERL